MKTKLFIVKVFNKVMNDNTGKYNFMWIQIDKDDNLIYQFDENLNERSVQDLDIKTIKTMILYPLQIESIKRPIILSVNLDKGEQFVRFWRTSVNIMTENKSTVYVIGIKKDNLYFLNFIHPDGTIYITTDYQFNINTNQHLLFNSILPLSK